jgi:hypothetical protein
MNQSDLERVESFLNRWQGSSGNERANYQLFFAELCDALGVERPLDKGRISGDPYCFDKDVKIFHPSGKVTPGFIDFYKANHFVIEAKQGGIISGKGTAKRGTATYLKEMEKAFVQAVAYTRSLESKPPFVLTCDIGDHFELWQGFNEDYGGYGAREEIPLAHLRKEKVFDLFVDIFTDPQKRNPEKIAAQVTREVAADLAELARSVENAPPLTPLNPPLLRGEDKAQQVANFLMRCIFTMFAEDVKLLPEKLFTEALETRWLPNPKQFKPEVEALWQAMNEGNSFGFQGKLLRFNGGLFAEFTAFELTTAQLEVLLQAAKRDWKNVEPAIFGTLLERALDSKERSKLGAHYTPRSYVERLVRPVVMEPLQERWVEVQAEAKKLLDNSELEPTAAQKKKAVAVLEAFLQELREVRILDPACGSGNFLYVTLDLLKGLESEVLRRLEDVTGQAQLKLDIAQVNPSQFLGIEINPRAAAIADLVIWIGYLKWHFKRFGNIAPVEPVLREYKNIECRDAVLAYDGKEPDIDSVTNKPRTRWGGRMMKHPVTGEDVPDPTDQIPIYRYINPRAAEWQSCDYIISNPPFIGNALMRERLGDGYAKTIRQVYKDVSETVDYVMYWWYKAAELLCSGKIKRFGFITTNSIRQVWQRKVIDTQLNKKNPIRLIFVIPDHPWTDGGAAVRIAMTGAELDELKATKIAQLGTVVCEAEAETPEEEADKVEVNWQKVGHIFSDLRSGANVSNAIKLQSNNLLAGRGVCLHGAGFIVSDREMAEWGNRYLDSVVKPYCNGRDLVGNSRKLFVVDFFCLSEVEAAKYEKPFQKVLEEVKPERDVNKRKVRKDNWWIFGETMPKTRNSIKNLNRYVATPETAKHRVFQFLDSSILPDNKLVVIALDDAYFLGILSSSIHVKWALAAGGWLGVGNDPVYVKTKCFDPFPFPDSTPEQKQKIRDLGERLDTHRKRVQTQYPDVTITGMYNLLEKMRSGEPFTDKDREYNNKALVSTLKQIHDELDAAVFDAYNWPQTLSDDEILERLVALNADRAEEERNGLIRWLRPEYQAPETLRAQGLAPLQGVIEGLETEAAAPTPVEQQPWPKKFKEQLAAIRDLLRTSGSEWTLEQIVTQFKGATRSKKAIQECLESLEELGILASHAEEGVTRWYSAELQKAS